jgi:RimJ/RimL family protein N-acetyltransferase
MSSGPPPAEPARAPSTVTLVDGTEVGLHPMSSTDADALVRFHHTLSRETTYLRFFAVHPELSKREVEHFTNVDHRDREALVATVGSEIVAVARFDRMSGGDEAEVAFVVADSWQGHGLGTILFAQLADRARALGVRRFVADTLPHNRRMLAVFHHAGLPCRSSLQDGVVHVVLDLDG